MILFKELNLPPIPPELIVVRPTPDKYVKDIGYRLTHFKNGKELIACAYINTQIDHAPLLEWIYKNIPGVTSDHRILKQVSKPNSEVATHIIHSDVTRVFALNYFLNLGGNNVLTSWFQEKGQPLHRHKIESGKQADTGTVKYEDCEVLATTKFKLNTWNLLATDILHDVDNITSGRASITISFNNRDILKDLGIEDV